MLQPLAATTCRKPRVLQCVSHLALGGAERVALNLAKNLRSEFEFEFFAVRGLADGEVGTALREELRASGIPVHLGARVPMRYGGIVTSAFGLARILRRVSPDLLHLHTEIPEAAYAALAALAPGRCRLPVVRTVHNAVFWDFWRRFGRWTDRHLAGASVAAVSNGALQGFLQLRAASGAPRPPVPPVVIYNGVDAPTDCARATRPARDAVRVVFGGRFEPQKGADLLPEILLRVRLPPGTRGELTLFGSGSHETALRQLAEAPSAGWTIRVCPPVSDFPGRLRAYDLVIMPSRFEGVGLVAVEALLAGVPVVATNAPGLAEVFPEAYPWLSVPSDAAAFASAFQRALDQRSAWPAEVQRAAAHAAARFSVAAMSEGYSKLYRQALSSAAGQSLGGAP